MNKRGLSPLIATVVLIAFAVALGAVIMNWGSHLVSQATNETYQCEGLVFSVHSFSTGEYDACFTNDTLIFSVESSRGKIDGLKLVAYTTGQKLFRNANVLSERLVPGEPQRVSIPYDLAQYGGVKEIELYPIIGQGKQANLCEVPFKVSSVSVCE
jgi:flagellin-like protein